MMTVFFHIPFNNYSLNILHVNSLCFELVTDLTSNRNEHQESFWGGGKEQPAHKAG
jgi:hypothetical protein